MKVSETINQTCCGVVGDKPYFVKTVRALEEANSQLINIVASHEEIIEKQQQYILELETQLNNKGL